MKPVFRWALVISIIAVLASFQPVTSQDGEPTPVFLPILTNGFVPFQRTKIDNIYALIETCPQNDPAFARIAQDLTLRLEGQIIPMESTECTEPVSAMPLEKYTNALITLQTYRIMFYLDTGTPGYLPWTSKNIYDWLTDLVAGINFKTEPGKLYCCDWIDGGRYISQSLQDDTTRDWKKTWYGLSTTVAYFVHEARHADGGPSHTTGCSLYPNSGDFLGCDYSYDLSNLGSYGVQFWLHQSWLNGRLNVGASCAADGGEATALDHMDKANDYLRRFVTNIPPIQTLPAPPYGGPCLAP